MDGGGRQWLRAGVSAEVYRSDSHLYGTRGSMVSTEKWSSVNFVWRALNFVLLLWRGIAS
jgi:hypothetical protein